MTDSFFLPPARTSFRLWHAALLLLNVASPLIAAAWYVQRRGAGGTTSTSSAAGVEPTPPTHNALRIFWIVAVLVGVEIIWDGWFIATELARHGNRPLPDAWTAAGPGARLVMGFLGGLALLGGAGRLNLQDGEHATRFLFRLIACAVVLGLTVWSHASVAELILLMAIVILAAHVLREFMTELTMRSAWQTLGLLVMCAFLFWAVAKFSRVGNLYAYQLIRGQKVVQQDIEMQMQAR